MTDDDEPLLRALECDRQSGAFAAALAALDEAQRDQLLDMQYRARAASYEAEFGDAAHSAVIADGLPAGRLLLSTEAGSNRIVDLVLLRQWRGRGIGTAVMGAVVAEALPVELSVTAGEARVVGWYRRLGFDVIEEDDVFLRMRRAP